MLFLKVRELNRNVMSAMVKYPTNLGYQILFPLNYLYCYVNRHLRRQI